MSEAAVSGAARALSRAGEGELRRLVDLMPAAVYMCEAPSGVITFYNDRAVELWGRAPRLGEPDERFCGSFRLHRPDGAALPHDETPMAAALREGRAFRNEEVIIERPDGSRVWVLVNIDPVRNHDGAVTGAVNVFVDMTALKEAEQALLGRTRQLSAFLEMAAIGLHRVGPDGTILWANDAELQMLGYEREEYVGRHIAEFHAEPRIIADMLARLGRGERLRDHEAYLRCKDGAVKTVLVDSSVLWEEGRFVHTQCFTRDITEQKRAQDLRARLAAIIDSSHDAILSQTLEGTIASWNRGAERLFGYAADEAIGRHISLIIPPECMADEASVLARIERGERIEHFETERVTKDGRRVAVSLSVSPIVDSNGRITGVSRITRDISERKLVEAERRDAERRKDEFLAMLSHELRNPLTPIRNSIHILDVADPASPAAREAKQVMKRQIRHLTRIVDDLLDVTRIARGKVQLNRTEIDVARLAREVAEDYRTTMRQRGLRLEVAVDAAAAIMVHADRTRLTQAIGNLLHNAAKFTPTGGEVALSVAPDQGWVELRVRDTGVGISPQVLPQLFQPFSQATQTLARAEGGVGLGLALVKGIVELHGGDVEAHSAGPGKGAQFVLRLPLAARAAPASGGAVHEANAEGLRRRRVLVVDDSRDAADSLAALLRLLGQDVQVVYDGPSALERCQGTVPPEVVLCDIGLPGMSGYEVASRIRRQGLAPARLVAISGYAQPGDVARALEAGFDAHIAKPFELEQLRGLFV